MVHNSLAAEDPGGSGNLRGARRRRAAGVRAGEGAADGAALLPLLRRAPMLEIKAKLKIARSAYKVEVKGQLKLPFESRQKSRLRTKLVSGEEVGVMMPRGEILRGGDLVAASDGRVIEVVAAPEKLLHVECAACTGSREGRLPPRQPPRAGAGGRRVPAPRGGSRAGGDAEEAGRESDAHRGAVRARGGRLRGRPPPARRDGPRRQDPRPHHDHEHDHDHEHEHEHAHDHDHTSRQRARA